MIGITVTPFAVRCVASIYTHHKFSIRAITLHAPVGGIRIIAYASAISLTIDALLTPLAPVSISAIHASLLFKLLPLTVAAPVHRYR